MRPASRAAAGSPDGEHDRDRCDHIEGGARHGIAAPRGLSAPPGSRGARFTRMFPFLAPCSARLEALDALVDQLEVLLAGEENLAIRAGYTYLGQFIDHDITFDATSRIDRFNDPDALVNFRTPRLDLDSLYGSGPADQPFLYDWDCGVYRGAKLLVGHNPPDGCSACIDLPRNEQGRALIGDGRNDENLIVSQLHLLFIKFHNRVVEQLHAEQGLTSNALFDAAHAAVRWHYQWIVSRDFLKKVIGEPLWKRLLPRLEGAPGAAAAGCGHTLAGGDLPAIPVEFSAAAYRFGHTMVRPTYLLRPESRTPVSILPKDRDEHRHLAGFRRLPAELELSWKQFFGPAALHSQKFDHHLAQPLSHLPPDDASLARLNLHRGRALRLPSGSDVAGALGETRLTAEELLPKVPEDFWPETVQREHRAAIAQSPPLWFYVLREGAGVLGANGKHLGPVGGRIVAETLIGLLEADTSSCLYQQPPWRPKLPGGVFGEMADLVSFTLADEPRRTP